MPWACGGVILPVQTEGDAPAGGLGEGAQWET